MLDNAKQAPRLAQRAIGYAPLSAPASSESQSKLYTSSGRRSFLTWKQKALVAGLCMGFSLIAAYTCFLLPDSLFYSKDRVHYANMLLSRYNTTYRVRSLFHRTAFSEALSRS